MSAAVLVDYLGIDRVIVPVLVDGHGTVRCQHGIIPVPVPATVNICAAHHLPLAPSDVEGELVTPTGAALVAALQPEFKLPERYIVQSVGQGAGKRTYSRPSILRAMIIEDLSTGYRSDNEPTSAAQATDAGATDAASLSRETAAPATVAKLECEIDDANPEVLAYAADRLREAGAREVHWMPVYCKKGRPAWQLQVICAESDVERVQRTVFVETTTNGIRLQHMERVCLKRRFERVETPWGGVNIKVATLPDGSERAKPEFEDCARIAYAEDVPVQQVLGEVLARYNATHR